MAAKASSHWPITWTNGAAALFNLFLPMALVRILSPDQVGRYKIFFLYVMLSPGLFLTSGLMNGLYHWVGKYPATKPEVRQSWTLLVGLTSAISAIGWVLSPLLASLIGIPSLELRLILVATPLAIGSAFLEDLMIARGNLWTGSLYASGFNVFRAASILAAAWWTRSATAVFWVFVAGIGFRAVAGWLLLARTGEVRFIFSWEKTANVLRYALPVSLAGLGAMAFGNIDQMILSFRLSPVKFAFYAIGCLSIPPLEIFESSVNRVMIPRLSQAFALKKHPEAITLFAEGVSELFRFLLPATVGLIIYSQPIIQILFTPSYTAAAQYLQIYALIFVFWSFPFDAVARARGDSRWILRTWLSFALLCAPVTWFAAGRWDAMGALIAMVAGKILMRLYSLVYDRRCFAAAFPEFLPLKDMGIQAALALLAAAVSFLLRPLFHDPRAWFFLTGPLFALIYLGGTYSIHLRRLYANAGPIRVLELVQTLGLGGLERTVYSLAQTLNRHMRFRVLVAAYDHSDGEPSLAAQFQKAGIPLIQWQKGKGLSLRSVFRLVRIIFTEETRILHAHDLGPLIYGSLAKFFSLGRVRLILTLHTLLDIQKNRRYRLYYRFFLRFADQIIAVSPGVQSGLLALGVPPERVEVIPNGVSFSCFSVRCGEPGGKLALRERLIPRLSPNLYGARWLLCLARLHPGKGQDVVLDVWSALPEDARAQLGLFFVGQETQAGYQEFIHEKIRAAADRERIVIAGPSEHPEDWIQCADLFISGSLHEGMPLAPLEAAGSGLPTLISDIEGHHFLRPWAHTFDLRKPEEGARKILEILETLKNEGNIRSLGERWQATSSLREKWGVPAMTASYAEIFQSN